MTTKITKILKAWCVEVGEEITITQALREYLSLESPPARFTFYCHDPACLTLSKRVSIIGANYRSPAEEKKKYVVPYFRSKDDHHPECQWLVNSEEIKPVLDETPQEALQRMARRKMTDLITVFDPRSRATAAATSAMPITVANCGSSSADGGHTRGNTRNGDVIGENRTSDLDRLVDSYLDAAHNLSEAEFKALPLQIVGHGETTYRKYFQWIGKSDASTITYGGIRRVARYGYGFKLIFFDKREGEPVECYISPEILREYRYGRFLKHSVDEVLDSGRRKYLKMYCMGRLEYSEKLARWDLIVDDLNHLVLRVILKERLDSSVL